MSKKAKIILISVAAFVIAAFVAVTCLIVFLKPADSKPPDSGDNVIIPDPIEPIEPKDTVTIEGAKDVQVLQGVFFDCSYGVTAVTDGGEDVTDSITVEGEVNTSVVGEYVLTYSACDGAGNSASLERTVTVVKNQAIGYEKPTPVYSVSSGTYNIAKGCKSFSGSASKSSEAYAFDGDKSTRWESEWTNEVYLTVDLGAYLAVEKISLFWEAAYATDFTLLSSDDGSTWFEIAEEKGQTFTDDRVNSYDFNSVEARYIRLRCQNRAMPAYGYSLFEFEVYGPRGTVVPLEEYPDLFDARSSGSPDWATVNAQWVEVDLDAVKSVDTVKLAFRDYINPHRYTVSYAGADRNFKSVTLRNLPYSGDTFAFYEGEQKLTLSARYFKIEMSERRFDAFAYRINEISLKFGETEVKIAKASASSSAAGHGANALIDGADATYWENEGALQYKTVDLKEVKAVGRVDLYWRSDDGGKGKYYDLQISDDGQSWTTVFRQTHGATPVQSVYVYDRARYIRIIDMQHPSNDRSMLEGMMVRSQYPLSSGEGKVDYDIGQSFPEWKKEPAKNGSYATGGTDFPSARLIAYLDESLRGKPVPSNDWWQGLLVHDKGYNMFMNPLTAAFKSDGLWLANHSQGYFDGLVPGNGSQTVNNQVYDLAVGYDGLNGETRVKVKGYSDYGITAVMTDDDRVDKLTVFLSQGSLYAYCIFAQPEKAQLSYKNLLGVYDADGSPILQSAGSDFVGDCIVIKVKTHSTYVGGVRRYRDETGEHENEPVYEERYYVVSVPEGTGFTRRENAISVNLKNGNYMSVGAVSQKNEVAAGEQSNAPFPLQEVTTLHSHGYAFVIDTLCTYSFDGESNVVTTVYTVRTQVMRRGFTGEAYTAFLPHQLAKSDYKGGYTYKSIRGDLRSFKGNSFVTRDKFYGVVPTFVEPTDDGYSAKVLYDQLLLVYKNNDRDGEPVGKYLISGDPYWQGKNLHPMSMAALAADQIGATDLRDKFLDKIEYILKDWFTYDPVSDEETGAFLYYDKEWGTLYYKNSEFGAGVNLADHYFTYGYYTLAAGVLCAYRPQFAEDWGDMVELLIRDYMNPDRDDDMFPHMRNFDMFAGHGWAGGYADNDGGNNQESAGEALNSWVGAYLYATATGNEKVRLAAIYGYTTELNAIKHYWFNYFGDFPESYAYGVAGQVYGGSNFYGTFFNGEPLYMYGIHLIPGEEYLTSYAYDDTQRKLLEGLMDKMRREQAMWDTSEDHKTIYAWQHIFIPIVAIYDPDEALEWYDEVLAKQGNVGNTSEQFNVYYLIHGMKSAGLRTTDIWAENGASATVYKNGGKYNAMCWNPTDKEVRYTFRNESGEVGSALVPARSLVSCDPTQITEKFVKYTDVGQFGLDDFEGDATVKDGVLHLDGTAEYLLAFGSEQQYYRVNVKTNADVRLLINGNAAALEKTADGFQSAPIALAFKNAVALSGQGAVTKLSFEKLELKKSPVTCVGAEASSVLGNNTADKVMDGIYDGSGRWESEHGIDGVRLKVELSELTAIYQLNIIWEGASASEYKVYFSQDGVSFTEVYHGKSSQGARTDKITPSQIMQTKYIVIECISRTTNYGYSIYEMEIYNFN